MAKLTYFPLVLDRWIAGTRHMTFEEKGMYLDLLIYLYEKPDRYLKDEAHMARVLGCRPQKVRRIWPHISEKFMRFSGGFTHSLVRELQRNGMQFRGLQRAVSPTKPDPEEEKENSLFERAKEKEEVSSKPKTTAHGTRLPEDWKPRPEDHEWAKVEFPSLAVGKEFDKFRDYWLSVPGQRGRKTNWSRTWRNWLRKAAESQPRPRNNTYRGKDENLEAMAAQLGLPAKPGESTEAWHMRIRGAMTRAH